MATIWTVLPTGPWVFARGHLPHGVPVSSWRPKTARSPASGGRGLRPPCCWQGWWEGESGPGLSPASGDLLPSLVFPVAWDCHPISGSPVTRRSARVCLCVRISAFCENTVTWERGHPADLVFTWSHLQRPYFSRRSHSEAWGLGLPRVNLGDIIQLITHITF